MSPNAPAANPTTSNTNQPFGGVSQSNADYSSASNILNYLPTQEANTTTAAVNNNTNPGSILPNININTPVYSAPTAPVIDPSKYGTDLQGYNAAVQAAEQAQVGQENTSLTSAQTDLANAEKQYGNLTPIYQSLASSYNIPGYQEDVATLSNLLQNLNKDVNAQTTLGGGLMTQQARDEMYANQANPLNTALNNASNFLSFGQTDVNNLLDTYEKSLTNALNPLETNISTLPTLFGQANSATEAGYSQGESTIQNTIQNRISQEEADAAASNAAQQKRYTDFQIGQGGTPTGLSSILNAGNGVTTPGSPSNFQFSLAGKPVSAMTWAANNGQDPYTVIAYMASKGDATAGKAYQEILSNPSITPTQIAQKYGALGGGFAPTVNQPAATPASSGNNSNFFNDTLNNISNFLSGTNYAPL